jgi:hypothetical protein
VVGAVGVFVHKAWARWTGLVAAVIGLLFGALMLLGLTEGPTGGADVLIVLVWVAAYGFATYGLAAGGEHFRPRYPGR